MIESLAQAANGYKFIGRTTIDINDKLLELKERALNSSSNSPLMQAIRNLSHETFTISQLIEIETDNHATLDATELSLIQKYDTILHGWNRITAPLKRFENLNPKPGTILDRFERIKNAFCRIEDDVKLATIQQTYNELLNSMGLDAPTHVSKKLLEKLERDKHEMKSTKKRRLHALKNISRTMRWTIAESNDLIKLSLYVNRKREKKRNDALVE